MRFLSFIIFLIIGTIFVFPQSPHGKDLKIDCANCHESTNWKTIPENIKFDHNKETSFKLTGQHASVDCQSCHKSLVFSEVKSECISCHKDIHQNTLGPECEKCHVTETWIVSNIIQVHQNSRFPLVGVHLNVDCRSCHSGYENLLFPPQSISCFSCHVKQYYATTAPNHLQANFSTNCEDCHSMTGFAWGNTNFDHSFFPLVGGHNIANCFDCHTQGSNFKGLSTDCYTCHKQQYLQTTNPNHTQAKFSTACQDCHNVNSFNDATFDHSTTGFALTGAHATTTCQSCHSSGYTNTPNDCYSCHSNDFNGTTDPNHVTQGFPHECTQCHSTTNWSGASFDHNTTGFPLTGKHTTTTCQSCHTSGYTNTPSDCYSCHSNDYNNTSDPNHAAQGFSHDCSQCHSTSGWGDANFDHSTTGFALTGAHATTTCQSCHASGYTNTPNDCYSCHSNDFNGTTDPNHVTQGFPHDCAQCHSTTNWSGASFDHNTTGFPLTGKHTTTTCQSCHTTGYTNTPSDCYSCHNTDYNNTSDPNHAAQGFSHDCSQCHSTSGWDNANFDHSTTGFALTGAHATTTCQSCHSSGYTNTSSDCYSCHSNDFNGTTDPNHVTQGFPHTCSQCHSTTNWSGASFDHNTTGFPLTGKHTTTTCQSCHSSGYTNTPSDCYSCHSNDYNNTNDPNHVAQGFSHDCSQCHSTSGWDDANFDHSTTSFPLKGAHITVTCQSCHPSGYATAPSTNCFSCHQAKYQGTTNPNHSSSGLPQTCQDCHNTTDWTQSTFNHTNTGFTLTGAHVSLDCSSCHKGTVTGLKTDCYSCHSQDYLSTTNPPHSTQGFPQECTQCHSTTNWSGASFDHSTTGFPLTGAHSSVSCQSCHTSGYATAPPTNCYDCHTSDFNNTNNPPHQSAGYPTDCTECHTSTAWSPSTFDHTPYFPLTGRHNVSCASCHQTISNFVQHSCNATCHRSDHHQNEDCYNCHKTGQGG